MIPTPHHEFLTSDNQNGKIIPGKLGNALDCGDHHLLLATNAILRNSAHRMSSSLRASGVCGSIVYSVLSSALFF